MHIHALIYVQKAREKFQPKQGHQEGPREVATIIVCKQV